MQRVRHGLDEGQDTYILMWNPDISSVSLEDHNATIPVMLTEYFNWSIFRTSLEYRYKREGRKLFF